MGLHYRYGWPFGKVMARMGVPTKIRVDVIRDEEAGVFIATSCDVDGLVLEAETIEGLITEARDVIPMLVCSPTVFARGAVSDFHLREPLVPA